MARTGLRRDVSVGSFATKALPVARDRMSALLRKRPWSCGGAKMTR